jgi:hypothetical protein
MVPRRRTLLVGTITRNQKTEAALLLAGLAAALVSFQSWRLGAAVAAAVLVALLGLRRGMPLPLTIAAAAAAGSALVHFAVAPEHFAEWWGFGLFFVLCAEVQLGWALLLGRIQTNRMLAVGIGGSLFLVAVWALSRTTGLPFGPEPGVPEEIGVPDVVSVVLELVTAAACAWSVVVPNRTDARMGLPLRALGLALTIALTAWALIAVGAA